MATLVDKNTFVSKNFFEFTTQLFRDENNAGKVLLSLQILKIVSHDNMWNSDLKLAKTIEDYLLRVHGQMDLSFLVGSLFRLAKFKVVSNQKPYDRSLEPIIQKIKDNIRDISSLNDVL